MNFVGKNWFYISELRERWGEIKKLQPDLASASIEEFEVGRIARLKYLKFSQPHLLFYLWLHLLRF
jgi:hypothetical protein